MKKVWHPIATFDDAVLFFRVRRPELEETASAELLAAATSESSNALIVRGEDVFTASFISLVTREYQDWKPIPGDRLAEMLFTFDYDSIADETDFSRALRGDPSVIGRYTSNSSTKWTASSKMLERADYFESLGIPAPANAAAVSSQEQVQ